MRWAFSVISATGFMTERRKKLLLKSTTAITAASTSRLTKHTCTIWASTFRVEVT